MKKNNHILILLCLFLWGPSLFSCEIPVFRYALERWQADSYTLKINAPQNRDLSEQEKLLIEQLTLKLRGEGGYANLQLKAQKGSSNFPSLELLYPKASGILKPAWKGLLNKENMEQIVSSPARKKLEKYILNGESIIWIVIENGNESEDDAFVKSLSEKLVVASKDLKLSDGIIQMDDADKIDAMATKKELDNLIRSTVPLKISFQTLRISRDDPQEELFLKMLLGQSVSLRSVTEPVAIPVFGRGRCIEGVPASKLSIEALKELTSYLCSGCSCTVKAENPGVDIVMNVPWADYVSDSVMQVKALPPLTGIIQKPALPSPVEALTPEELAKTQDNELTAIPQTKGLSAVFIGLLLIVLIGGISFFKMSKK